MNLQDRPFLNFNPLSLYPKPSSLFMAISRDEVKRISALARIALTGKEETLYEKELSSVLEFVAELERVDTKDVSAMTGGTDLVNVMRPDKVSKADSGNDSAGLIGQAPERFNGWIKVPSVFE